MSGKVIFVDLDGTICTEEKTFDRPLAKLLPGARQKVNQLYKSGHTIVIWTARGWEQFRVTEEWLRKHSIKYHQLLMGKPIASIFIDDRARRFDGWDKDYISE